MKFQEANLSGVYIIDLEAIHDERGFFSRAYCFNEFAGHGLNTQWVQENISFNPFQGTFRGMHFQVSPHEEIKLVRCTAGAIYDVALDLRPDSSTFKQWVGIELSASNRRMFYLPAGFAHGYQTLKDNTEVYYHVSEFYHPESARGYRWNDPAWNIQLPLQVSRISDKDNFAPDYLA